MNILEFAINMEKEGEIFYRILADKNKENGLHVVFAALADDEKNHAEILSGFFKDKTIALSDSNLSGSGGVFKNQLKNDDIKQELNQLDTYRDALAKEQESIDLYRSFLDKSNDIRDTKLFGYLIEQEEIHYSTIEDIIYHLEKAESWVESPEFGVREDY